MKLSYDFHIHSCLSPCGDAEMTPNNIVHMAQVAGLDMIALTDHNTCKNCPALLQVAKSEGFIAIPGMELCTAEEVHVVCLFSSLEGALEFDAYVAKRLPPIENEPAIFGEQWVMDAEDRPLYQERAFLMGATTIPITEVEDCVWFYGGVAIPAHIDKDAYSVFSNLGFIPPECHFKTVEIHNPQKFFLQNANCQRVQDLRVLTSSDAHYLWDIASPKYYVELEQADAATLVEYLKSAL